MRLNINEHEANMTDEFTDKDIIKALGGPKNMARMLGYALPVGQWRVNNWVQRGIPASVKVKRPDLLKAARRIIARRGK